MVLRQRVDQLCERLAAETNFDNGMTRQCNGIARDCTKDIIQGWYERVESGWALASWYESASVVFVGSQLRACHGK